jgi:anti-sigma B factor antagonist
MEVRTDVNQDIVIVQPMIQVLDAENVTSFKHNISPMLEQYTKLVLDMSHLHFVDSSGCGAILSCVRHMTAKGGELKITGLQQQVRTLFEIIRMHRIIDIHDSRDDAVRSYLSC